MSLPLRSVTFAPHALAAVCVAGSLLLHGFPVRGETAPTSAPVSLIDVTDLYHFPQDPGDNFDLIAPYALPELDLKAIILDVTESYRPPHGKHPGIPADLLGPREPGFIPVLQLNRVFDRNVPVAAAPFRMMKTPDDLMLDAPKFEQEGIDLLLRTVRESTAPVEIVSFGSARPVALAYNREPELLKSKVRRIHFSAGSSDPGFMEWNVMLDPAAVVCLLRSPLPVAIYPCGTKDGAFAYGPGNTFWKLDNLEFLSRMDPALRGYLAFAFERMTRPDFLRVVEPGSAPDPTSATLSRSHNVWETGIWLIVTGRKLVRRADGRHAIIALSEMRPTDTVLPNELRPCRVEVRESGEYLLHPTTEPTNKWMYYRGDPKENEVALREALPAWYTSLRPQQRDALRTAEE